jgi:hypothetical protein
LLTCTPDGSGAHLSALLSPLPSLSLSSLLSLSHPAAAQSHRRRSCFSSTSSRHPLLSRQQCPSVAGRRCLLLPHRPMHLLLNRPTPPPPPLACAAPSTPDRRRVKASSAARASSISSPVLGPPTPPSSSLRRRVVVPLLARGGRVSPGLPWLLAL